MKLWMLSYHCDDFYCQGEHIVGVYTSEANAAAALQRHHEKDITNEVYKYHTDKFDTNKDWE